MRRNETVSVVLHIYQQLSAVDVAEAYQVQVQSSPWGSWGGPFLAKDLDDAQIQMIRSNYRTYLERFQTGDLPVDERSRSVLQVAGAQLFRVFPDTIRDCVYRSLAIARKQGKAFELVLAFDRTSQSLLGLPWELLYDPDGQFFLALQGAGITRQVWLSGAPKAQLSSPKKWLGLWAEPQDISDLSVRRTYSPVPGDGANITWLTGSNSLKQLETALDNDEYDGLHIVSHGRVGKSWGEFYLALEANGETDWVTPDQLATLLVGYPSLRHVYLEICAGAKVDKGDSDQELDQDIMSDNLAVSLLGAGVSTVVAMQDYISQEAAGLAAQTFHYELAQGQSMPQAITASRRAIRLQLDDPLHWSVPVLYVQTRPAEERSLDVRMADWILENIKRLLHPRLWLALTAMVWSGALANIFARWDLRNATNWRQTGIYVMLSSLLYVMGALSMQYEQTLLGQRYQMDRQEWLRVFLSKYFSAAIWGFMWWIGILSGWLALIWMGVAVYLNQIERQGLWTFSLLGLFAFGYVGARQAIRQLHLFQKTAPSSLRFSDWLLFLAGPMFPIAIWGVLDVFWGQLTTLLGMFFVTSLLLGILALARR